MTCWNFVVYVSVYGDDNDDDNSVDNCVDDNDDDDNSVDNCVDDDDVDDDYYDDDDLIYTNIGGYCFWLHIWWLMMMR